MKYFKILWIVLTLLGIILLGNISNALVFRRLFSDDLFPTYDKGEWVVTSSLLKTRYNDVVCLKSAPKDQIEFRRLLAIEGDTVEMKDGYLLRNGFMTDDPEKIGLSYYTRKEIKNLEAFKNLKYRILQIRDTVVFNLTYAEFKQISRQYLLRLYRPREYNFPVQVIPKGFCLVGSDLRELVSGKPIHQLFPIQNIVGKVL